MSVRFAHTEQSKNTHSMTANKRQKQLIAINLPKEQKANVIAQLTGDETKTSANDLTFDQANALLESIGVKGYFYNPDYKFFDRQNKQHRRILVEAIFCGWKKPHPKYGEVADIEVLKTWLQSKRSPVPTDTLVGLSRVQCSKIIEALSKMHYKNSLKG
jgi:hypothetical protein